jgi:hypothetical protein
MHRQKSLCRRKRSIKGLFNKILQKKTSKSNNVTTNEFIEEEDTQQNHNSSSTITCCSRSTLKRYEKVKEDQEKSTEPIFNKQQLEEVREFLINYRLH